MKTISLSPDKKHLYLIDNHQTLVFPLDEEEGILVGQLNGQLAATSASQSISKEGKSATEFLFPLHHAHYNLIFKPEKQHLVIIGTADIDGALKESQPDSTIIGTADIDGAVKEDPDEDPAQNSIIGTADIDGAVKADPEKQERTIIGTADIDGAVKEETKRSVITDQADIDGAVKQVKEAGHEDVVSVDETYGQVISKGFELSRYNIRVKLRNDHLVVTLLSR